MRNLGRWMVVGVASAAVTLGIVAPGGNVEAGGSICPNVFAPVMQQRKNLHGSASQPPITLRLLSRPLV
jgi:hypothetical protein